MKYQVDVTKTTDRILDLVNTILSYNYEYKFSKAVMDLANKTYDVAYETSEEEFYDTFKAFVDALSKCRNKNKSAFLREAKALLSVMEEYLQPINNLITGVKWGTGRSRFDVLKEEEKNDLKSRMEEDRRRQNEKILRSFKR